MKDLPVKAESFTKFSIRERLIKKTLGKRTEYLGGRTPVEGRIDKRGQLKTVK